MWNFLFLQTIAYDHINQQLALINSQLSALTEQIKNGDYNQVLESKPKGGSSPTLRNYMVAELSNVNGELVLPYIISANEAFRNINAFLRNEPTVVDEGSGDAEEERGAESEEGTDRPSESREEGSVAADELSRVPEVRSGVGGLRALFDRDVGTPTSKKVTATQPLQADDSVDKETLIAQLPEAAQKAVREALDKGKREVILEGFVLSELGGDGWNNMRAALKALRFLVVKYKPMLKGDGWQSQHEDYIILDLSKDLLYHLTLMTKASGQSRGGMPYDWQESKQEAADRIAREKQKEGELKRLIEKLPNTGERSVRKVIEEAQEQSKDWRTRSYKVVLSNINTLTPNDWVNINSALEKLKIKAIAVTKGDKEVLLDLSKSLEENKRKVKEA